MDTPETSAILRAAREAEALRRAGNAEQARKTLEQALRQQEAPALRVALGLALEDLGETDAARRELEQALVLMAGGTAAPTPDLDGPESPAAPGAPDALAAIADAELEDAFLQAESRPDEMWNANNLAEAALAQVEEGTPEGVDLSPDSPFATATVAGLLEEQGHADEAQALRQAIAGEGAEPADRERILATLERWLDNLRRAT